MTARVYKMTSGLKNDYRHARDLLGLKTTEFVEQAVSAQLPGIEQELLAIGLGLADVLGGSEPVKFDLSEVDIASLNETAGKTGIPATILFRLCLARASAVERQPKKTRRGRKGGAK
jgi:hypothetical protein